MGDKIVLDYRGKDAYTLTMLNATPRTERMTQAEKIAFLRRYGYIVGVRDRRLNINCSGAFMVAEPYEENEFPLDEGNGPWCIVGDNLGTLVDEGHEFLVDHIDPDMIA